MTNCYYKIIDLWSVCWTKHQTYRNRSRFGHELPAEHRPHRLFTFLWFIEIGHPIYDHFYTSIDAKYTKTKTEWQRIADREGARRRERCARGKNKQLWKNLRKMKHHYQWMMPTAMANILMKQRKPQTVLERTLAHDLPLQSGSSPHAGTFQSFTHLWQFVCFGILWFWITDHRTRHGIQ